MIEPGNDRAPDGHRRGRRRWLIVFVGAAAFTALVLYLVGRYPDAISTRDDQVSLVRYLAILTFLASGVLLGRRIGMGAALRHGLVWLVVILALVLGYSYRGELLGIWQRLAGELAPSQGVVDGGTISYRASADGHYHVEALVDGTPIRFLVDTGASDIVLTPADAERLGFKVDALTFSRRYETANGSVQGAPVRLDSVEVGPFRFRDVAASVNAAPMASSLLGMSFLDRLGGYTVRDGVLTLHP